ncbi:MAG: NAD-dependent epimerase/dehydratase family protein [Gammaproteobacteria bacterium]|nr:NAD-dependent epimerase/dehydratase family protein [Gammaproteobacteria bacterium]NIR83048.1 NAD-dependent epimerase/dehydratase family protein [Gammaproteobacteria bacterium]NIR90710.1 NAD-dependent epimerase/dehydratase family protein [Gammaproteobacteria bacterium]NIU04201.1 NAD-dependent epimerase/dehydratase family protein [Gammaproteobacteria bacterium]NIV51493.1 NAD-dependent epimerase/dehydratase family protein [Gammaproteobacteria bacterium]
MTTVITGATGFVGSAVLRRLLDGGHEARALVRAGSDKRNVQGLRIDTLEGDLRDRASLERILRGCEALFHVAADYRLWVRDPRELYESNVAGTRNILLAAGEAGVRRIVYTSSVATLGLNADGSPADEDTPVRLDDMIGHYKRSKFLAEAEARRLAAEQGLPVVIVNPSAPVGPRDVKPTPTGRVIVDAASGRLPAYVDTGLNIVHVDDVADGHWLAFERGRIGERYILGGENLTLREILTRVAALVGRPAPRVRLPHRLVLPVAYVAESWARVWRRAEPRVTVDGVRMARKLMYFSSDRARRELGFVARPADAALREALEWFRANGYLS